MVRDRRACDACTRNCITFHQKQKDSSNLLTRFWKAVLNEEYLNLLFLPPKFARIVKLVAGQETQIEDASGQQWSVRLSYVNGSLAFQEGWNKFFVDHGLEVGDLLVFNYVKRSHFVVQIYGKSSCERISFNKDKSRGRKKLKRDSVKVSVDEPSLNASQERKRPKRDTREVYVDKPFLDVASGSECQHRQTRQVEAIANLKHRVSMDMEDPICLINRDDEYHQSADRNVLFDLSSFEIKKETLKTIELGEALDMQIMPCLDETIEQGEKADDTQMDATFTYEIDGHSHDVLPDKSEKAVGSIIALPPAEEVAVMDVDQNAEAFMDEVDKVVDKIIALCHTEKVAMADVNRNAEVSVDRVEKILETNIVPPHTENVAGNDVNQNAEVFVEKVVNAVNTKIAPPHTETKEQMKTKKDDNEMTAIDTENVAGKDVNQDAMVFMDKAVKVVNAKIVPPYTEITEQMKTLKDETEMAAIGPTPVADHSAHLFTDKSHIKPFDRIDLSKEAINNNSISRNGNNNVLQTDKGTPSLSSGKIVERKYPLRSRDSEAVPRSAVKGKVRIKNEPVEFEEQANLIAGVSSDAGKEPTSPRKRGRPVIKSQHYDTVTSDAALKFSARVESQEYLELPIPLQSTTPIGRGRKTKVVYLKDPMGRISHLLYQDEFSFVRALTTSWRIFCDKNGIKPGDECRFQSEIDDNNCNADNHCLFRVDITRSF